MVLLAVFNVRIRATGPAFAAVLALWTTYIVVVEPLERALYDTRTFTLAVNRPFANWPRLTWTNCKA